MKYLKLQLSLVVVAVLSLGGVAVLPVSAQHGSDDSSGTSVSSSTSDEPEDQPAQGNLVAVDDSGTDDTTEHSTNVEDRVSLLKTEAKQHLSEQRANHKEHSQAVRDQVCQNHEKAINNKLKAFDAAAQKHLSRLNDVFTKLQNYQSTNNVAVSDYDTLVATATQKQTDATTAVNALVALGDTITCDSTDPAASLSTVKTAAADARNALKDYRKALKDIVVALAQAKDDGTDDSSSTEGN